jgi:cytochrome c oxidase assembly protein subunit 15
MADDTTAPSRATRRLAYAALVIGYAQIVFGAIVRISGSGLGCGEHWPDCYGTYTPGNRGLALLIEISHRYGAALLSLTVLALFIVAWKERKSGISKPADAFAPGAIALGLVVIAAIFGAITVKLGLSPLVVVTHLAIAMTLLAVLVEVVVRTGGLGGAPTGQAVARSSLSRSARAAIGLTFVTLLLGALTANWPGASTSCLGFFDCSIAFSVGKPFWIQITHRLLAVLLIGHLTGMSFGSRKREPGTPVARAALVALSIGILQLVIGTMLIGLALPFALRSIHQAIGTLLWISVATLYALTKPR